ncbi:aldehyde dehydrogenase family protein [Variovorax sp. J31P207]|uniref:aldehyde dehydrogenase family protein n=1 Tax=Variovorax sp. J31P207 TaxID=3053510 RepID=UPI002579210D|nr:aldehyde dehydrogenase family protein [Variovorax sp. J31P207]MDM0071443.1 aldehyde dehydrogenase family protein [Variovorax sp. J31P207]
MFVDTFESMRVVSEKVFGPVVVCMPFNDVEDVARQSNDAPHGLGAFFGRASPGASHSGGHGLGEHPPHARQQSAVGRLQAIRRGS